MSWIGIEIFWVMIWLRLYFEYRDAIISINGWRRFAALLVLFIGGPSFLVANILEATLDLILPEGWDNNDDDDFKV